MPGTALVTVFVPADTAEQLVAESVLTGAGIPFFAKNAGFRNLYPGGFNAAVGSIELQVPQAHADAARSLLSALREER